MNHRFPLNHSVFRFLSSSPSGARDALNHPFPVKAAEMGASIPVSSATLLPGVCNARCHWEGPRYS